MTEKQIKRYRDSTVVSKLVSLTKEQDELSQQIELLKSELKSRADDREPEGSVSFSSDSGRVDTYVGTSGRYDIDIKAAYRKLGRKSFIENAKITSSVIYSELSDDEANKICTWVPGSTYRALRIYPK